MVLFLLRDNLGINIPLINTPSLTRNTLRTPPPPHPHGPKCRPNIDMFRVISSDGISWEELACAKEKSTVLKAQCFQFATTCFKLATYLLRSGAGHGDHGGARVRH